MANNLSQQVEHIGADGALQYGVNSLTAAEEGELREHLRICEVALADCPSCTRLYQNIGHTAYAEALTKDMDQDGEEDGSSER